MKNNNIRKLIILLIVHQLVSQIYYNKKTVFNR